MPRGLRSCRLRKPIGPRLEDWRAVYDRVRQERRYRVSRKATREEVVRKLQETPDGALAATVGKVSLICPISSVRIRQAAKGSGCAHLRCFDLESFLLVQTRKARWDCPLCEEVIKPDQLRINEYFNDVLASTPKSVKAVELLPDGSYRETSPEEVSDVEIIDDELPYHAPQADEKPALDREVSPSNDARPRDAAASGQMREESVDEEESLSTRSAASEEADLASVTENEHPDPVAPVVNLQIDPPDALGTLRLKQLPRFPLSPQMQVGPRKGDAVERRGTKLGPHEQETFDYTVALKALAGVSGCLRKVMGEDLHLAVRAFIEKECQVLRMAVPDPGPAQEASRLFCALESHVVSEELQCDLLVQPEVRGSIYEIWRGEIPNHETKFLKKADGTPDYKRPNPAFKSNTFQLKVPAVLQIARWLTSDDFVYRVQRFNADTNRQETSRQYRVAPRRTIEALMAILQLCEEDECHVAATFYLLMFVQMAGFSKHSDGETRGVFRTRLEVIWSMKVPAFCYLLTNGYSNPAWYQRKLVRFGFWARDFWDRDRHWYNAGGILSTAIQYRANVTPENGTAANGPNAPMADNEAEALNDAEMEDEAAGQEKVDDECEDSSSSESEADLRNHRVQPREVQALIRDARFRSSRGSTSSTAMAGAQPAPGTSRGCNTNPTKKDLRRRL